MVWKRSQSEKEKGKAQIERKQEEVDAELFDELQDLERRTRWELEEEEVGV